jgi:hypothetical protein
MVCWNVNDLEVEADVVVPSSWPAHLVGPFCFVFRISDLKLKHTLVQTEVKQAQEI